jgi:hypothetical protein
MKKVFRFRFFLAIVMFIAMIAVFSVAGMFLWNVLMPEIFGLPALNYWQAAGMVVLARILFGGLRPGRWPHGGRGRFHDGNAMREKWMNMSEEERVEFVRTHRGFHGHPFFDGSENSSRKDSPGESGKDEEKV